MRPYITVLGLALLLSPGAALAAGNVLLPAGSDDGSSLPELGLGSTPAAKPVAAPAAVESAPVTQAAPSPPPVQTVAPATTAPAVAEAVPSATVGAEVKGLIAKLGAMVRPVDKKNAARLPLGTMPTQVIDTPDDAAILAKAEAALPYSLDIAISGQSLFGAQDVQDLTTKFGLTREQIPSSCVLSVRGLIQTDKGGYILYGDTSPVAHVRYDGMIASLLLNAEALCTASALPPGSGYVQQVGGRYRLNLQQISCPPPNRQTTGLTVTYDGTAKAQCVYQ